jgi:alpha-glucosidase
LSHFVASTISRFIAVASSRRLRCVTLGVTVLFVVTVAAAAQTPDGADLERLANGVRVHRGDQTMEITTLRDDVIRVRAWQGTAEPENSSWAVLPEALRSTGRATPESAGFSTDKLHVAFGPGLMFTVTDSAGNILEQDAESMVRRGTSKSVFLRQ